MNRALDMRFRTGSGMGSVMERVFQSKPEVDVIRAEWRKANPGKQLRYK
jgi:hypothetical protein